MGQNGPEESSGLWLACGLPALWATTLRPGQPCSAHRELPASGLTRPGPGGEQSSSSSGGSIKVVLSAGRGTDWLTFEGLFLSEGSLNLDLDFCSATMHSSL